MEHFARYLELSPHGDEAQAVAQRMAQLETDRSRTVDPSAALTLGLLVPRLGRIYSGRPTVGLTVLGAAASAVAAGLMVREVDVRCLGSTQGNVCPSDQLLSRRTRRPRLTGSLIAAGAITVIGAIDTWLHAGGAAGTPSAEATAAARSPWVDPTARLSVAPDMAVEVALVRISLP